MEPIRNASSPGITLAILVLALGSWSPASADQDETGAGDDEAAKARAQELFDQGVNLLSKGRHRAACDRFQASLDVYDGVGTRGKLAECYEKLGRVTSAWRLYHEIIEMSDGPRSEARVAYARERIEALAERLPYLTIIASAGLDVEGITIELDGRTVGPDEFGSPIPVDPGTRTIIARAPGYEDQRVDVELVEKESRTAILDPMRSLEDQPESETPTPAARTSTTRVVGYTAMGMGAAGVVVGLYFGGSAYRGANALPEPCRSMRAACTPEEDLAYEAARTDAVRSTYSFIIGGALLGAGVTLWWLGRSERPTVEARTTMTPTLTPDAVGWTISGTF